MNRIKKGDTVKVIAGKSKNHIGKVIRVLADRIFVEGANLVKKHIKRNPQKPETQEGIVVKESGMHISNVAMYNSETKKADKVGFKYQEHNGIQKKVRYFKSTNVIIDRV